MIKKVSIPKVHIKPIDKDFDLASHYKNNQNS